MSTTTHQGAVGAETMTAGETVTILYENYRGETAVRRITPIGREWFGSSEWHPEPQWLFTAFDMDKEAFRDFARAGVKAWGQAAVDAALSTPAPRTDGGMTAGEAVKQFAHAVLHGDDEHRGWLTEAAECFVAGRPLPEPRGKGTQTTPAQPAGAVPDSLRVLSEAASEDWDTNDATPYILGPQIDGEIDRFEVIARGPHGHAKNADSIRKWQANRMFAVAAVNFVRTLLASHPAGQSAGSGAEIIAVALADFQRRNGYHKPEIEELLTEFGELLLSKEATALQQVTAERDEARNPFGSSRPTVERIALLMGQTWLEAVCDGGHIVGTVEEFGMVSPEDYAACCAVAKAVLAAVDPAKANERADTAEAALATATSELARLRAEVKAKDRARDDALKAAIRAWSAKLHIPVTRMMSRELRAEFSAALARAATAGEG